jgi:hypothetical protein
MLQSCASVFAFSLGFVAVVPAFAAIVPIAISQQVSASGGVGCLAPDRPCTPPGAEFSFSASNTQPGPYSVNKTGQAAVSAGPFFFNRQLFADAQVQQTSDETINSMSLDMSTVSEISGDGVATLVAGNVEGVNYYSFEFNLTNHSLVHLTGSAGFEFPQQPSFGSASADSGFLLTGDLGSSWTRPTSWPASLTRHSLSIPEPTCSLRLPIRATTPTTRLILTILLTQARA